MKTEFRVTQCKEIPLCQDVHPEIKETESKTPESFGYFKGLTLSIFMLYYLCIMAFHTLGILSGTFVIHFYPSCAIGSQTSILVLQQKFVLLLAYYPDFFPSLTTESLVGYKKFRVLFSK